MSENYRALTRKYRPQNFEDIVSQDHVSSTLMNAIKQNRLSHAYMFCGPRGVGKTTMARVLARTINEIDNSVDGESLNQTLNVVEMDAASNNKVDDVHHLRETVRIPPQNGRYKVFIVDEVHMLSKAAFNALLKTLEEPPEHAIFIFATTEPHKVLPTILSRVQRFDFKRIAVDEIVRRLRKISVDENISIDDESLHVIAKKADGALRDALGLMDQAIAFCGDTITHNELVQALNVVGTDRLFQFMNCVKEHDADQGLELINTLLQEGYDIQEFLIGLTEHLRNLYIAHHSKQLYMVEASEETKSKYKQFASDFSRDDLMRMLHLVSEAQIKIKDANQPRIQFEITLLKLIHMERSESLAKLLSDLEEVKKNSKNLASLSSPESKPAVQEKKNEDPATEPAKENVTASAEESSSVVEEELPSSEQEQEATKVIDDEFDIGTPALQTRFSQVNEASKEEVKTEIKVEATTQHSQEAKNLQIEDIKSAWPEFIDSLNGSVSSILKMQTERALPVKLKGTELSLECDNQLAKTMLDEQAKELAGKLQECIGVALRFNVEVSQKIKQTKARNPYERFKEIQQKDPMIRSLVERFGAELEY
ncbi:DNA polymerase III subunit gamma/tau [bacterium]|nr:DNA polymerase III subunit gamma/tau [Balneola sp.]MBR9917390.1 DNA polymerase III subunit gamma/tau [bacterium]